MAVQASFTMPQIISQMLKLCVTGIRAERMEKTGR